MSSPFIPREKLSAYQRWELRSFDDGRGASAPPAGAPQENEEKVRHISQRAHRDGFEAGYREGAARMAAQASELATLVASAREEMARLDELIADDVLALAVVLAQRVAHRALKVHPELVLDVVREAIRHTAHARVPGTVMLHPADAELVRAHLTEQLAGAGWTITEDVRMARGGCRFESAGGELDATLPHRWQRVAAALGQAGDWLE